MTYLAYKNNSVEKPGRDGLDKKKFEVLFRRLYSGLCNFACGYTQNRNVAEDLVQSAFINVWEHKNIWDSNDNIRAYLYKSVKNKALNHLKHQKVKQEAQVETRIRFQEWKENASCSFDEVSIKKIVAKGVQQLPERRQEIYLLSRESGLTYREIADVLGLSVKTIETQMGRALKSLRLFLSQHLELPVLMLSTFLFFL